jgi:hypothetical protein
MANPTSLQSDCHRYWRPLHLHLTLSCL